jgi:hypothetical protein
VRIKRTEILSSEDNFTLRGGVAAEIGNGDLGVGRVQCQAHGFFQAQWIEGRGFALKADLTARRRREPMPDSDPAQ